MTSGPQPKLGCFLSMTHILDLPQDLLWVQHEENQMFSLTKGVQGTGAVLVGSFTLQGS